MKKGLWLAASLLVVIALLTGGCAGQPSEPPPVSTPIGASGIQMTVTVNGLEKGEEAVLRLLPDIDTAEEVLFEQTIRSDGEGSITVDICTSLKDGNYQLLLEAPDKYFREPKGYCFQVSQSQIVNPTSRPIVFNLIPPSAQTFRPYRESDTSIIEVPGEEIPYMLEAIVSLSGPVKQGPPTKPLVSGTISGLLNSDDLVTVHAYTVTGWEKMYFTREGNGPWEAVIPNPDESEYYTITAEAEGYTTQPASYKIKIEGEIAYVVKNNEIGEEALHIDFQFSPNNP